MTSTKMLSPRPMFNAGKCKSTPPRRIRPVSLFSALASPSPQKLPSSAVRLEMQGQEHSLFQNMKVEHQRLLQERMISAKPFSCVSPHSRAPAQVKETPPKRIQPVRLLFASPSPPKALPGLAEAKAKGGLLVRTLSFDSQQSPSKTSRVTFSPKPSIQTMYSRDSPKKLLLTPTKVPAMSGSPLMSPRSILKSPLRSPPHFNMYFTQQPSPLVGKGSAATSFTPKGKKISFTPKKSAKISPEGIKGNPTATSSRKISPQRTTETSAPIMQSPMRASTGTQTRAVRKIFSQLAEEAVHRKGDIKDFERTNTTDTRGGQDLSSASSVTSQESEQMAVPLSPSGTVTPRKRMRRISLRSRMSPYSGGPRVLERSASNGSGELFVNMSDSVVSDKLITDVPDNKSPENRVLQEIEPTSVELNSSQESEVRTPHRRINKRRREKRAAIAALDESANLSVEDSLERTRSKKRQRSPEEPTNAESSLNQQFETPSKKRKTAIDSEVLVDSSSNEYFRTSEIFAASKELPEIGTSNCSKFARLGSNSNDFDTSQAGMLRSRLRCQFSGASDSNSNLSYDLPSSPVFTSGAPILKNKSLERILSSGCDVNMSDSEVSSRASSPVFGKRVEELRGVTPTNCETIGSGGSPVKSAAHVDLSVSPSESTRSKTSPGQKKYSPNVSAKGLAELINSPLHYETISPSLRKVTSPTFGSTGNSPTSVQSVKSSAVSNEQESKLRTRRSLYRTETKSSL